MKKSGNKTTKQKMKNEKILKKDKTLKLKHHIKKHTKMRLKKVHEQIKFHAKPGLMIIGAFIILYLLYYSFATVFVIEETYRTQEVDMSRGEFYNRLWFSSPCSIDITGLSVLDSADEMLLLDVRKFEDFFYNSVPGQASLPFANVYSGNYSLSYEKILVLTSNTGRLAKVAASLLEEEVIQLVM